MRWIVDFNSERRTHKRFVYEADISHDLLAHNHIYKGKLQNFSKGGLYFESELLGSSRDGKIEYPTLKSGKPSKAQQDVDAIVELARDVLENSGIKIENVQAVLKNDQYIGHADFISDKISISRVIRGDFVAMVNGLRNLLNSLSIALVISCSRSIG